MKDKILKHTGLTEKQFYSKYKTADDFFNSAEGKSFKKAQNGYMGQGSIPQQFGSAIGKPTKIPKLLQDPYQGIDVAKPKLPTDPLQEEMDSAYSLVNPYKKGEAQAEGINAAQQTIGQENTLNPMQSSSLNKFGVQDATNLVSGLFGAGESFLDERKRAKEAKMWQNVTGLQLAASRTKPEKYDRKYVRPEDQEMTGEELFPIHGVGTNPIAQDGSMIPGNPTEIQNTFDPYDIYDDGGYEPLNDSVLKQFQIGGVLSALSGPVNSGISSMYNNNAGSQIGGLADYTGIPGLGTAGRLIGGKLDETFGPAGQIAKAQAATNRNIQNMGLGQQAASVQAGFASHMQDGGNVNPQILKYYGDHTLKSLLKPDPMMDTLQGGGEIKSLWGGGVKPQSYNPYMDGNGITYNSYGNSHHESDGQGRTGIGISVAQNGGNPNEADVEIERREPIADVGGDKVVYGNLPINKQNAGLIGDPKAVNKRFKNYIADLNKQENKNTKALDSATKRYNSIENPEPLDTKTYEAQRLGFDKHFELIAAKKQRAAHLQNAINETRDELSDQLGYTISAEQLAKNGKITKDKDPVTKMAKWGTTIEKAQSGKMTRAEAIAKGFTQDPKTGKYKKITKVATKSSSSSKKAEALGYVPKGQHKETSGYWGGVTPEQFEQTKANNPWYDWTGFNPGDPNDTLNFQQAFNNKAIEIGAPARLFQDDRFGKQTASAKLNIGSGEQGTPGAAEYAEVEDPETKNPSWMKVLGAALPYIRPSNAGYLDPNQLMGEMYAMSNNQVEPVQAQSYQPQLDVPYDISLQDQLNQVTSQTRGAQRLAGYNPAAQAAIAAQSYAPANQILGEQFRLNQAKKDQVYSGNRATMNQARMTNLGLYDQQAQRQSQAVSNTKAITQAALNSISDKYQKNALENKTLQTYENLYNYRFGPKMRAYNVNAPFNPNMPVVYQEGDDSLDPDTILAIDKTMKEKKAAKASKKETVSRNGSIVSALKRI